MSLGTEPTAARTRSSRMYGRSSATRPSAEAGALAMQCSLGLRRLVETLQLAHALEPLQRLLFDPADLLARHPAAAHDLLDRLRVRIAVEPVAQLHDLALALRQLGDGAAHLLLAQADLDHLVGSRRIALEQVTERGLLVLTD